jgi:hypothetical protein
MPSLPRLAMLAAVLLSATAANADALLNQLRAESAKAPVIGFERTVSIEEVGNKGRTKVNRVERFDPNAPAGKQWTLVSVDGRAPTLEDRKAFERDVAMGPVPGFHRLGAFLKGEPTKKTPTAGGTIYHWQSLQPGALGSTNGPDISTRLSAEALVKEVSGEPVISRLRIYAAKPFSIMMVAKMHSFDAVTTYRTGRNGLPFIDTQSSDTDASIPMRGTGTRKTRFSYRPLA